jgi:putative FmdB family regulatory protein
MRRVLIRLRNVLHYSFSVGQAASQRLWLIRISGCCFRKGLLTVRLEKAGGCRYAKRMPIYEFHCEACGRDSELLVRSMRWEGTQCPHCGSDKLVKQLSVFASGAGSAESARSCGLDAGSCDRCCGV